MVKVRSGLSWEKVYTDKIREISVCVGADKGLPVFVGEMKNSNWFFDKKISVNKTFSFISVFLYFFASFDLFLFSPEGTADEMAKVICL